MKKLDVIPIALVEDHVLVRQGLASLLKREKSLNLLFTASNGREFFKELNQWPEPQVVLLDLGMPEMDGIAVLKQLQMKRESIKAIMLSMHVTDDFISEAIRNGASGYLAKDTDIEEVIFAIHEVVRKGMYYGDCVGNALVNTLQKGINKDKIVSTGYLTPRELEVIELICLEKTTKEIAEELHVSVRTVETHRSRIFEKTESKNVAGVILYAVKNGLVRP